MIVRPASFPPPIDDPSNRWLIHPLSRLLLRPALKGRISANAVSLMGLLAGFLAALAYSEWRDPAWATAGFALMVAWHVADGLDGLIARTTGTSSDAGRLLDGLCDYSSFILVYLVLIATLSWNEPLASYAAAVLAGALHIVQAALYEGSRARFLRRAAGQARQPWGEARLGGALERLYARIARGSRTADAVDRLLARPEYAEFRRRHVHAMLGWQRLLILLGANGRTLAIYLACLAGRPAWFWWWEIIGLSTVALVGFGALHRLDRHLLDSIGHPSLLGTADIGASERNGS